MDETDPALAAAADIIAVLGRRMDQLGWVSSLGGNISLRLDADSVAITRSGGRKGFLGRAGVIRVDLDGRPTRAGDVPSAETALHVQVYRERADAGAVLHGHSVAATVLSRLVPGDGLVLRGYEMIKAFAGQTTHDTSVTVPMFDNDQDMDRLAPKVAAHLRGPVPGYILRGHGVYAWGRDAEQAIVHLEALEFLLACELATRQASQTGPNAIPS